MINVPPTTVIERHDMNVVLAFHVASDCAWFEGHFPQMPILPGVVQIGFVAHFAAQEWGFSAPPARLERVKFKNPIWPDSALTAYLSRRDAHKVKCVLRNDDNAIVSSVILCFDEVES